MKNVLSSARFEKGRLVSMPNLNRKYRFCLLFIASLSLFSCRNNCDIPTIEISADSIGWANKEHSVIRLTECGKSKLIDSRLKFRGGMSSRYYKRSYSIVLSQKHDLVGLPPDFNWVLNASYIDKTFMRHKLCFDLFMKMGAYNLAPQTAYARVFENDRFEGLYLLMQRLGPMTLNVDINDSLAFVFKEPPIFYPDITGHQKDSMYVDSHRFSKLGKSAAISQLEELENLIYLSDDEDFESQIFKLVDIENIIDWQLLLLFSNNSDGQLKNFYAYRQNSTTPIRIAIWDYDHSLGRDGDNERNLLERVIDERRVRLFQRLLDLNPEGFNQKISKRWQILRKTIFTESHLFRLIDENDRIIRKHISENEQRWPIDSDWYFDNNNYEQELKLIKEYISLRLQQLDKRFAYLEA